MKFVWDDYHQYEDGSWNSGSDCDVYMGDKIIGRLHIEDHTTDKQKASDKKSCRRVLYAWEIHDTLDIYDGCWGRYGIDKNEDYYHSTYQYVGTPKHTLEEVKNFYENKVCESYMFDYDAELKRSIDALNKMRDEMNEAVAYKNTIAKSELIEGE